jgi:hypothetical protein
MSLNNEALYSQLLQSNTSSNGASSALDVQAQIQQNVLADSTTGSNGLQKQLLQLISSAGPSLNFQSTVRDQLSKGRIDIRV